jgi:hypothetical protein
LIGTAGLAFAQKWQGYFGDVKRYAKGNAQADHQSQYKTQKGSAALSLHVLLP